MRTNLLKKVSIAFFILLFMLSSICFAVNANETEKSTSNTDENASNSDVIATYKSDYKNISSDLFLFDTNIEMSDIVDGNVFAYGSTVKITGVIYGDLFVFSDNLEITKDAVIHGNVFTYSNTINISGIVSDVYAMGNNFTLNDTAILARNLYLYSNTATLSGKVSRDAYINTSNLSFGENSEVIIKNNLHYTSKQEFQIPDGVVGGEVSFKPITVNTGNIIMSAVINIIKTLLFSFAIIMLSVWLAPKFKEKACEIISKKSFVAFGIGLLAFFGTIIATFILLLLTYGFGVTIALFAIGLLILAYTISNTVFSMSIGKLLSNKFKFTKTTAFVLLSLLIVLVIELVKFIPYVGGPITFITSIIGLGILGINAYKRKDLVASQEKSENMDQ